MRIFYFLIYEQTCKPGSVFDGHLSNRIVTDTFKPYTGTRRASLTFPKLLRIGFTRKFSYHLSCALLPHISTLTPRKGSVYFLLHCPWSRLRRPLAGILLCGARTFLICVSIRNRPVYSLFNYILFFVNCQILFLIVAKLQKVMPTLT